MGSQLWTPSIFNKKREGRSNQKTVNLSTSLCRGGGFEVLIWRGRSKNTDFQPRVMFVAASGGGRRRTSEEGGGRGWGLERRFLSVRLGITRRKHLRGLPWTRNRSRVGSTPSA